MTTSAEANHATIKATYTYDDVEAAMCVWEWLLVESEDRSTNEQIKDLFGNFGSGGMRCAAMQAAAIIEGWWRYTQDHELPGGIGDDPFDWEFVPAACRIIDWPYLVEDNQYLKGEYCGQTAEAAIAVLIAMKAVAA